ncbi:MAG: hypothetical protein RH860_08530 [Cytophagales bacterium]
MRLAQLARKISKKPAEIIDFLASQGIKIEASSNAKVADEHASMVLLAFAKDLNPDSEQEAESQEVETEQMPELLLSAEADKPSPLQDMEIPAEETSTVAEGDTKTMEMAAEKAQPIEVIKAPKVELAGLKVVGKIDLPEPKKKVIEEPKEQEEEKAVREAAPSRGLQNSRRADKNYRDRDRKPRMNPIALQREREQREVRRMKKEEEKKLKELRTKRYLSKVKPAIEQKSQKKRRKADDQPEQMKPQKKKSKGFFGKIVSWLTAH